MKENKRKIIVKLDWKVDGKFLFATFFYDQKLYTVSI